MKIKLSVRLAVLISILSVLFISVFTFIQIRNQLDRFSAYNRYRARVGTIIVKTTLEMLLKDVQVEEALPALFEAAVDSFSREEVVEKVSILKMDGTAVASNDPLIKEFGESKSDIDTYLGLAKTVGPTAWFYSTINKNTMAIDIYIPITGEPGLRYIAKLSFSTVNIAKAIKDILLPISLTIVALIVGNLILGYIIFKTVVRPVQILNTATKGIASGDFDFNVHIKTKDEIQELGDTFNDMISALKKMKEKAENANPLTKLPGNNIIREEVEKRIRAGKKFVAIHVDLDNFKSYNDRYGIAKGDEVIKFTSQALQDALKLKGNSDDFLGHEGGDDFFIITSTDKAEDVAHEVISEFEARIGDFYSPEDFKAGFIMELDRRGEFVKFPIMTISLAGVTNQFKAILNYAELTNIAVTVKHQVKQQMRSIFLLDRRKGVG